MQIKHFDNEEEWNMEQGNVDNGDPKYFKAGCIRNELL